MPLDQVNTEEQNMTFIEHLEELRWHLVRSVAAIFIFAIAAFVNGRIISDKVIFGLMNDDFLTYRLLCKLGHALRGTDVLCIVPAQTELTNLLVSGQFIYHLILAVTIGIILAFPYIMYEFWKFLKPALKQPERKKTGGIVLASSGLFFFGVLFGYFIITPLSFNFLASYNVSDKLNNSFTIQSYVSFVTTLTLASGIIFELPLVIYFLSKMGLVSANLLKKYRKISVVVALLVSAILTPPDVLSQILLSMPIYFLYEVGIVIAKNVEKKRDDD
jgi:sec-independent protein translocase protein TatC